MSRIEMGVMKHTLVMVLAAAMVLTACGGASGSVGGPQAAGGAKTAATGQTAGAAQTAGEAKAPGAYRQISMEEALAEMAETEGYLMLDVRTKEEFADGHIPGAVNIPVETIGSEAPAELPDREQRIYVYCRSGNRSKQASQKLVNLGYADIVEFGGIRDYKGEVEK